MAICGVLSVRDDVIYCDRKGLPVCRREMMFNNFVTRPFLRPLFMLLVMVASNVRSSSLLLRGSDGSFSAFDNRRITDENLILYCPQKNKTCSPQEEHRYLDASVTEFDKRIRDLLYDDYYPTLESKAHEFNGNK